MGKEADMSFSLPCSPWLLKITEVKIHFLTEALAAFPALGANLPMDGDGWVLQRALLSLQSRLASLPRVAVLSPCGAVGHPNPLSPFSPGTSLGGGLVPAGVPAEGSSLRRQAWGTWAAVPLLGADVTFPTAGVSPA